MANKKLVDTKGDFIEHGSQAHADLLGLWKAKPDDSVQYEGWTLVDMTMFGPQATEAFLRETLRQKVAELNAPVEMPQSKDFREPGYRKPIWEPVIVTDNV